MTSADASRFLDEIQAAINSGRWIDRSWWTEPLYQQESGCSVDGIRSTLEALTEVFDESWANSEIERTLEEGDALLAEKNLPQFYRGFLNQDFAKAYVALVQQQLGKANSRADRLLAMSQIARPSHPIFHELFCSGGLSPFTFIYDLGQSIRILKSKGSLGKLKQRLRHADQFEGACAEVLALRQWLDAGLRVRTNVPSGVGNKNCEWEVSDGTAVLYGEVKCIELAPANKRLTNPFAPAGESGRPYDLKAEADKIMDTVEDHAGQLPLSKTGMMVVSGRGGASALPLSDVAARRIVCRFEMSNLCHHIGGVLILKSFLIPEAGLIRFAILVENPRGPKIDIPLLTRGFPFLQVWGASTSSALSLPK